MSNKQRMIVSALVCFALISGVLGLSNTVQAAEEHTITVQGLGEVVVKPDIANINFGVQTEATTVEAAMKENTEAMSRVKEVLATYNIVEKDIKSIGFYVQPSYNYKDGDAKLVGYQINHILQVSYRELDKVGKLLDDLSKTGVNRIDNISYATQKQTEYELAAMEKAMANARAKAEALAKASGQSIKGVAHIAEGGYSGPIFLQKQMEFAVAQEQLASNASPDVYSGELTISKNVQVVYIME